jgi:hypothetical protein
MKRSGQFAIASWSHLMHDFPQGSHAADFPRHVRRSRRIHNSVPHRAATREHSGDGGDAILRLDSNQAMMFSRLSALLKLVAAVALVLVLIDAAAFRSGWYYRWAAPNSTTGSTVRTIMSIRHYFDPARRNVLVLGNSQVGEGFSFPVAETALGRDRLHFINGSIAGTLPRVWNYLLRKVDPKATRYAAIVMMVDYDATYWHETTDYPLDTPELAALLRLTDLRDYPASFTRPELHSRAVRTILFPMQAMREDLADFLLHPSDRLDELEHKRRDWINGGAWYGGHNDALPDLSIDKTTGMPADWSEVDGAIKTKLESYFNGLRTPMSADAREANIAYEREWIGRIAARYRANGVPVIVFQMPRGPWHGALTPAPRPNAALLELQRAGDIEVVPGDAFVQFEQPRYFTDTLHMNHAGREAFSALLAQKIAPLLH